MLYARTLPNLSEEKKIKTRPLAYLMIARSFSNRALTTCKLPVLFPDVTTLVNTL
jgi:hypothetical protein